MYQDSNFCWPDVATTTNMVTPDRIHLLEIAGSYTAMRVSNGRSELHYSRSREFSAASSYAI